MGISDYLTCLLGNLHYGQEAKIRIGHETTDWFKIGKGLGQDYTMSPAYLYCSAEYSIQNARLDESHVGIKIAKEISTNSDMQMTPPLWQKAKKNKRGS